MKAAILAIIGVVLLATAFYLNSEANKMDEINVRYYDLVGRVSSERTMANRTNVYFTGGLGAISILLGITVIGFRK